MTVLARALVSWLLALGLAVLVGTGAVCLGFGNFVVAWQSFTAQGFEPIPLRNVPLLGGWAEGFGVGQAPLAALYAMILTVAMNIAILVTAKVTARALRSYFDRRQALRSNDPGVRADAPAYLDQAVRLAMFAVVLLFTSVLIVHYDVAQFRFRYEDLFSEGSDPADVLVWAPDAVVRLGGYLASFIRTATWGYVGCVIAMAVALEYAMGRAGENWEVFHNALEAAIEPDPRRAADEEEAGTLGEGSLVAADLRVSAPIAPRLAATESAEEWPVPAPEGTGMSASVSPPIRARSAPVSPPPTDDDAVVNVIVGPGRTETFSLAEVLGESDRFVRDSSGRTWFLRSYWEQVTGGNGHAGAQS